MKTYLVGYDLNKSGQNYDGLIEKIKELGVGGWWHHLDSTFIIKSNSSAMELNSALLPYIDINDEILVIRVMREAAWRGFNKEGDDWLMSQLSDY